MLRDNMGFIYEAKIMWCQLDFNMHLRHSAYSDIGTEAILDMLSFIGLTYDYFDKMKIGPVIFKEELNYLKEIKAGEIINVVSTLSKIAFEGAIFSVCQEFILKDGSKAAVIHLEGGLFNTESRTLAIVPQEMLELIRLLPKSESFIDE
jgi:acyl-CoA thioester hydrolase